MSMNPTGPDGSPSTVPIGSTVTGTYCIEVMLSAGARKHAGLYNKPAYRELGEDAAGVLALPIASVFWLADGTGGEPTLPHFSPRILAQDAGTCLLASAREHIASRSPLDLSTLLASMFSQLHAMWQDRITNLWKQWQASEAIDQYLSLFSSMGDGSRQISWSSVFIVGLLHHETAQLDCVSWGDAGCLVQSMDSGIFVVPPTSNRLWVTLMSDSEGAEPPQVIVGPGTISPGDIIVCPSVQQFICLSDGNYRMPLESLFERQSKLGVANLARVIKGLRQDTYDDRSLILGTYIERSVT